MSARKRGPARINAGGYNANKDYKIEQDDLNRGNENEDNNNPDEEISNNPYKPKKVRKKRRKKIFINDTIDENPDKKFIIFDYHDNDENIINNKNLYIPNDINNDDVNEKYININDKKKLLQKGNDSKSINMDKKEYSLNDIKKIYNMFVKSADKIQNKKDTAMIDFKKNNSNTNIAKKYDIKNKIKKNDSEKNIKNISKENDLKDKENNKELINDVLNKSIKEINSIKEGSNNITSAKKSYVKNNVHKIHNEPKNVKHTDLNKKESSKTIKEEEKVEEKCNINNNNINAKENRLLKLFILIKEIEKNNKLKEKNDASVNFNRLMLNFIDNYKIGDKSFDINEVYNLLSVNRDIELEEDNKLKLIQKFPLIGSFFESSDLWQVEVGKVIKINDDEDIDIILKDVLLKKFNNVKEYYEYQLSHNKKYTIKWDELTTEEKKKYENEYFLQSKQYDYDLAVVSKYLFFGLNAKCPKLDVTGYDLYYNDQIIERYKKDPINYSNDKNLKDIKVSYIYSPKKSEYENKAEAINRYLDVNEKVTETMPNNLYCHNLSLNRKRKREETVCSVSMKNYKNLSDEQINVLKSRCIEDNIVKERVLEVNKIRNLNENTKLKYYDSGYEIFFNQMRRWYNTRNNTLISLIWNTFGKDSRTIYHYFYKRIHLSYQFIKIEKDHSYDDKIINGTKFKSYYGVYRAKTTSYAFFLQYYRPKIKELVKNKIDNNLVIYKIAQMIHNNLPLDKRESLEKEMQLAEFKRKSKREETTPINQYLDEFKLPKNKEKLSQLINDAAKIVKNRKRSLVEGEEI